MSVDESLVTSYYAFDGHGSTRFLSDATGAPTDYYTYDAFGNLVYKSGTTVNAYLYCGEQYDSDLGLYDLRARYMEPGRGRFWTTDTITGINDDPSTLHKYLYCSDDPVLQLDPSGNDPDLVSISITSGIIGGLSNSLATVATPKFFRESPSERLKDAFGAFASGFAGGVLGTIVGGPLGSAAGKLFWQTTLGPFIQGAVVGATQAAIGQVFTELFNFIDNPNGFRIKDAAGRTVIATFAGFTFGGLLVKYDPILRVSKILPYQNTQYLGLELNSLEISLKNTQLGIVGGAIGGWLSDRINNYVFPTQ